jgi:anti-anti-sigma factor
VSKTKTNSVRKIIRPGKDLNAAKAANFRKRLIRALEQKIKELVMDFSKVESVDSVGLGVIIAAHNMMKNADGKLTLINVPEDIFNLFNTMGLNQHFKVKIVK